MTGYLALLVAAAALLIAAWLLRSLRQSLADVRRLTARAEKAEAHADDAERRWSQAGLALADAWGKVTDAEMRQQDAESRLAEAEARLVEHVERIHALTTDVIVVEPEPLTEEQRASLLAHRCMHCGGSHTIACPRVKRLRFRADGQTPLEVEFWPLDAWRDAWAEERIVWPEDVT